MTSDMLVIEAKLFILSPFLPNVGNSEGFITVDRHYLYIAENNF